jgi:hypothetical protein
MRSIVERAVKGLQYGERKRPELRSRRLLINAQVAYAPRTVTKALFTLFAFFALFAIFASPSDSPNVAHGQEPQARIKIDIDRAIGDDKKVRPATRAVSVSVENNGFNYTFPAHSLTILRLRLK